MLAILEVLESKCSRDVSVQLLQMINLGVYGKEVCWPDAWTVATADGKRSAQFEETLL